VTTANRSEWKDNSKAQFYFVEQLVDRSCGFDEVTLGSDLWHRHFNRSKVHALNGLANSLEPECLGKLSLNKKRAGHWTSNFPMALDEAILRLAVWRCGSESNVVGI
jgi:hypothetical protein